MQEMFEFLCKEKRSGAMWFDRFKYIHANSLNNAEMKYMNYMRI